MFHSKSNKNVSEAYMNNEKRKIKSRKNTNITEQWQIL
jgi:hypothetical protein